jgi:hypothetical protein
MAETGAAKAQQNTPDLADPILYSKLEDWARIGAEIGKKQQSAQWDLGDWILGGESKFSKQLEGSKLYEEAEAFSGVARQSLYKYAYVARHVCIRMQDVCWAIHQLVAPLPEDEQKRLLHRAQAGKLTVSQFRNALDSEVNGNDTPRLFSAVVQLKETDYKLLDKWAWARDVERAALLQEIVVEWLKENRGRLEAEATKRTKVEAKLKTQRQLARSKAAKASRAKQEKQWKRSINTLMERKVWEDPSEAVKVWEVENGRQFPFNFARKHTEFGVTFGADISAEAARCGEYSDFGDHARQHETQASL